MRKLPSGWFVLVWVVLGFIGLLEGVISGNVVWIAFGASMMFGAASLYLTTYVKSEHRVKRASEVILAVLMFSVFSFGYIVTRSLVLGVITLFIVGMFCVAFVASYLLPKIRSKSKSYSHK